MSSLAVKPETSGATELAVKLRTLHRVFADEVEIDIRAAKIADKYTPRSLEPLLVNFRKSFTRTDCSASDIEIKTDSRYAEAVFSCRFKGTPKQGAPFDEVRDVTCHLQKSEGVWKINRVVVNDILER